MLFLCRLQYLHSSSGVICLKDSGGCARIPCPGQQIFMFFQSGWQQNYPICSHLHQNRDCCFSFNGCLTQHHFLLVRFRDKAALNSQTSLGTPYMFTPFNTHCSPKTLVLKGMPVSTYSMGGIYLPFKLSLVSKHPLL